MGNALSVANPSEILPVEHYLQEFGDNIESLGSTRFMKAARVRSLNSGVNVYKVFIIEDILFKDTSLNLNSHRERIFVIRNALNFSSNCCVVKTIFQHDKHAVLMRTYHKYTLHERLSTRPFINSQDRMWYIYQLFRALADCQKVNVCHGDLKSQNVVISSSNWLQIVDFAPFKPTYLPQDNPSSYTFFFDTSRRQACNLAPERFLSTADYELQYRKGGDEWLFSPLKPEMDMFSAGCVIYEMFCDGRVPFSYGQLCDYKSMQPREAATYVETLLLNIPVQFRPLLKILLNRDPALRMSADQVLSGTILKFPAALGDFFDYLKKFRPRDSSRSNSIDSCEQPTWITDPDSIITRLASDMDRLWKKLEETDDTRPFAVLFISLITSNLRSLRSSQIKVDAMNLLVRLATLCDPVVSTERVLPYLVFLLGDPHASVRASAILSIVSLTRPLDPVTVEDSLIFVDYLIPEFAQLVDKRQRVPNHAQNVDKRHGIPNHVLLALAANLGNIAQTALRFMNIGRDLRSASDDECSGAENLSDAQNFENEVETLARAVADLLVALCSAGNVVRHCVIEPHSLSLLYSFFAKTGNRDILLIHMITFLNAKSDWQLRAAFFDALPVAIQTKNGPDVKSLLLQGLHDSEDLVVVRAINCIVMMIGSENLDIKSSITLLKDCVPFLFHPNQWIRVGVVNLIVLLDSCWTLADVHSKLLPTVKPFLLSSAGLLRYNNKLVLLNELDKPIDRVLWDRLLINLTIEKSTEFICELARSHAQRAPLTINDSWFLKLYNKPTVQNSEHLEHLWKILVFKDHLPKMLEWRKTAGMELELTMAKGRIDLSSSTNANVHRKTHDFEERKVSVGTSFVPVYSSMNREWNEMFSNVSLRGNNYSTQPLGKSVRSVCDPQVLELLSHKTELYMKAKIGRSDRFERGSNMASPTISGTLITHLHEHTNEVTQIAVHPDEQRFASCSQDGSIRIWGLQAVTGQSYGAVRSQSHFFPTGKDLAVKSIGWSCRDLLAFASCDGKVAWTDITTDARLLSKVLIPDADGTPEQIHVDDSVLYIRTHHGVLYCLDLRVGRTGGPLKTHEVWRREVEKTNGLVTSFCVDPWRSNWMALGCTNQRLLLWDLRYQQEVSNWDAPSMPLNVWANPMSSPRGPEIFVACSSWGVVSSYNINIPKPTRTRAFWPSFAPPLSVSATSASDNDHRNITTSLAVCSKSGAIYSGDTQGALRKWLPNKPFACEYLSGQKKVEGKNTHRIVYTSENISYKGEILPVIRETRVLNKDMSVRPPCTTEIRAPTFHRTAISSISCLGADYLLSGASDGVIKIWK